MSDGAVAICSVMDSSKKGLLPLLNPAFQNINLGGREGVWVVACEDADEETQQAFDPQRPVVYVRLDPAMVQDWPKHDRRADSQEDLISHLRWMARCREAVRYTALYDMTGIEWLLWWDLDVEPMDPDTAFLYLLDELQATTGRRAPRQVTGLFPCRHTGQLGGQLWGANCKRLPDGGKWFNSATHYIPITEAENKSIRSFNPEGVTPVSLAGFGFRLWSAETGREFPGWGAYDSIAGNVIGEDVYADRFLEGKFGTPLFSVGRVPCRHYRDDSSYWEPQINWGMKLWEIRYRNYPHRTLTVGMVARDRDVRLPLQEAAKQLHPGDQLLLIDAGGNEIPWDLVESGKLELYPCSTRETVLNYARLKNVAISEARGEDVILIDADIILPAGRLDFAREMLAAHPAALLFAGNFFLPRDMSEEWRIQGDVGEYIPSGPMVITSYGMFIGARKEDFLKLKERDGEIICEEFYGWGSDDYDLHDRWTGKLIQCPSVLHLWHPGTDTPRAERPRAKENWALLQKRRWLRENERMAPTNGGTQLV